MFKKTWDISQNTIEYLVLLKKLYQDISSENCNKLMLKEYIFITCDHLYIPKERQLK